MASAIALVVFLATCKCCLQVHALDRRPFGPLVDTVDVIWISHVYDLEGNLSLTQFVFLDYDREANRFQVRAWKMAKDTSARPLWHASSERWRLTWQDGAVMRQVRAGNVVERWDQGWDPELEERLILPAERRRELSDPCWRPERSVLKP